MSTQSLHLIEQEVEGEGLEMMERVEIRSRTDSPSLRSATVLETLMTSISSQLTSMTQQQGHFSKQLSSMAQQQGDFSGQLTSMSYQQSHLNAEIMDRLDRVEESIHGSGKGSPNPDSWTSRPVVTTLPGVAPEPLSAPSSFTGFTFRGNAHADGICPETEPLRRSLRLLNKPRPDYRFPGRAGETELPWVPSDSRNESECPYTGPQPNRTSRKTTIPLQSTRFGLAPEAVGESHTGDEDGIITIRRNWGSDQMSRHTGIDEEERERASEQRGRDFAVQHDERAVGDSRRQEGVREMEARAAERESDGAAEIILSTPPSRNHGQRATTLSSESDSRYRLINEERDRQRDEGPVVSSFLANRQPATPYRTSRSSSYERRVDFSLPGLSSGMLSTHQYPTACTASMLSNSGLPMWPSATSLHRARLYGDTMLGPEPLSYQILPSTVPEPSWRIPAASVTVAVPKVSTATQTIEEPGSGCRESGGRSGNPVMSETRKSAEAKPAKVRNPVKLPTFNGLTPLASFLKRFEVCSLQNQWSESDRRNHLICALVDEASQFVLESQADELNSAEDVIEVLQNRYGTQDQQALYRVQLSSRKQRAGEELGALFADIQRLVSLAYPGRSLHSETFAIQAYLSALEDRSLALKVAEKEPVQLQQAYKLSLRLQAYQQAEVDNGREFGRNRGRVHAVGLRGPESPNDALVKRLEKTERELRELKRVTQGIGPPTAPFQGPTQPPPPPPDQGYGWNRLTAQEPWRRNVWQDIQRQPCQQCGSMEHRVCNHPNRGEPDWRGPPANRPEGFRGGPVDQFPLVSRGVRCHPVAYTPPRSRYQAAGDGYTRNSRPKRRCYRCHEYFHIRKNCPLRGRTAPAVEQEVVRNNGPTAEEEAHDVPVELTAEEVDVGLDATNDSRNAYLSLFVHNQPQKAVLDSGSGASICPERLVSKRILKASEKRLLAVNGTEVEIVGQASIPCRVADYGFYVLCLVSPNVDEIILGLPFMCENEVQLDFDRGQVRVNGCWFPIEYQLQPRHCQRTVIMKSRPSQVLIGKTLTIDWNTARQPRSDWSTILSTEGKDKVARMTPTSAPSAWNPEVNSKLVGAIGILLLLMQWLLLTYGAIVERARRYPRAWSAIRREESLSTPTHLEQEVVTPYILEAQVVGSTAGRNRNSLVLRRPPPKPPSMDG